MPRTVFARLLNGTRLVYPILGPWRLALIGVGTTVATIATFDRMVNRGSEPSRPLLPPPEKPTALNQVESRFSAKMAVYPIQSLASGFASSLYKPYTTVATAIVAANGKPVPQSELLAALYARGITPMIVDGFKVMAQPEHYARAAEHAAQEAVDSVKDQIYDVPRKILTGQLPIMDAWRHAVRLRDTAQETTRQASTAHSDGLHLYDTMLRYYCTSKIFELVGGVAGGGVTAWTYNRYLANPAQAYIGPFTRGVSRVGSIPFRTIVSRQMANEFGNLMARRAPLAALLMIQAYGVLYKNQREFETFVNEFATSYPEVTSNIIKRVEQR